MTGAVAAGIGNAFGPTNWARPTHEMKRALAHGISGGAIAEAQGGKFGAGFLANSFSSLSNIVPSQSKVGGVIKASIVGGTASKIGGGSFENGATTGAFTYLFNHAINDVATKNKSTFSDNHLTAEEFKSLPEEVKRIMRKGLGDTSFDGNERGGVIEMNKNGDLENYYGQEPVTFDGKHYLFVEGHLRHFFRNLFGWKKVMMWHTHPRGDSHSPVDFSTLRKNGYPSVVLTEDYVYIANPGAYKEDHLIKISMGEALYNE